MEPDIIDLKTLGPRLQEARRARGLTQQQIADFLNVARTTVVAIEKGERNVLPGEIVYLASLYGRSVHELLRRRNPLPEFSIQFRTTLSGADLGTEQTTTVIEEFQRLSEDYLTLEELTGARLLQRYPPLYELGWISPEQAGENVATAERNRLGLGDGPVPDLRVVLENDVGLRIFCISMPPKVAALFAFNETVGGCIALNSHHPAARQRWSLAHEYAHFLTRRYQADVMALNSYRRTPALERFADSFAKFFLMPAAGISRRFNEIKRARQGKVTPADLIHLTYLYQVSFEALTRHLESLDLLSSGTYEDLVDRGFKVRQAQKLLSVPTPAHESQMLPLRYQLIAGEAFHSGQLSEGEFARFLRLDRLSARELFQSLQSYLTISEEGQITTVGLPLGETLHELKAQG
ncbi:MAG: ImmA/IrrE family metallo-endopeptidase [Dehalococcoidia bacterium]|nr:ImmA/IrrE family metallo-endopeptidase [Dehalococcoidia bacterium]